MLAVARELFMLALSRYGLKRGVELKINWPGRIGVAPTMGAPFFAMAGVHWLALIMLYSGLALSLTATVLYVRDGLAQTLRRDTAAQSEERPAATARSARRKADSKAQLDPMSAGAIDWLARKSSNTQWGITGMDTFPDLGSLSDQELKDLIKQLTEEEMEISYRRRILHGKIDILRAELVNRLRKKDEGGELVISGADVQQLTDILAGRVPAADNE